MHYLLLLCFYWVILATTSLFFFFFLVLDLYWLSVALFFFFRIVYCTTPKLIHYTHHNYNYLLFIFKVPFIYCFYVPIELHQWPQHFIYIYIFLSFFGFPSLLIVYFKIDMAKRAGRFESGQSGCGSNMGYFKRIKNGFGSIGLRVGLGWPVIFHMIFFLKEKIMYLLFGKSCNKLLDVECIILNSSLIKNELN